MMALAVRRTKYGTAHTCEAKPYVISRSPDLEACESLDAQLAASLVPTKPSVEFQRSEEELLKRSVWELPDHMLVGRLSVLDVSRLNVWEANFAKGCADFYAKRGRITWGQRKYARAIVIKVSFPQLRPQKVTL